LLVHSGSRSLGESILGKFIEEHKESGDIVAKGALDTSEEFQNYLKGHNLALNFARRNRFLIAHRLLSQIDSRHVSLD
jgi:release factor H-coupled RctB family protein